MTKARRLAKKRSRKLQPMWLLMNRPGLLPPFMRTGKTTWLYDFLSRNVRRGNSAEALEQYAIQVNLIIGVITVGLLVAMLFTINTYTGDLSSGFFVILALLTSPFIVVDLASIVFGLRAAHQPTDQADLPNLTPIEPETLVEAQWQLAQTQSWRFLLVLQSIRLTIGVISVMAAQVVLGVMIITLGGFAVMIPLVFLEPVWRLEAMTAAGVFAGTVSTDRLLGQAIGFGIMLIVWIAQGMLALLPVVATISYTRVATSRIFAPEVGIALYVMFAGVYFGQRWLRNTCLKWAAVHRLQPITD